MGAIYNLCIKSRHAGFGLADLPAGVSIQSATLGLTVFNTSTSSYGLTIALYWWVPALAFTTGYFVFLFRRFKGKIEVVEAD